MTEVFLSYAREDRDIAQALALELRRLDVDVWWDHKLVAGTNFRSEITRMLDQVSAAIVIWSPRSTGSEFVTAEASVARQQSKLVPVSIDRAQPPIDFTVMHTIALDESGWQPGDALPDALISALGQQLDRELTYQDHAQRAGSLTRLTRQVTRSWWSDLETFLFFFIGQVLACALCCVSIAAFFRSQEPGLDPFQPDLRHVVALLAGFVVAALYMRPYLRSLRIWQGLPIYLVTALVALPAYVGTEMVLLKFDDARVVELVGPATLLLLLVTTIADRSIRSR